MEDKEKKQQHDTFLNKLEASQNHISSHHLAGVTILKQLPEKINNVCFCLDLCAFMLDIYAYDLALKLALKEFCELRGYYLFRNRIIKLIRKNRRDILKLLRENRNFNFDSIDLTDCSNLIIIPGPYDTKHETTHNTQFDSLGIYRQCTNTTVRHNLKGKNQQNSYQKQVFQKQGNICCCQGTALSHQKNRLAPWHYSRGICVKKNCTENHTKKKYSYRNSVGLEEESISSALQTPKTASLLEPHRTSAKSQYLLKNIRSQIHKSGINSEQHKTGAASQFFNTDTLLDDNKSCTKAKISNMSTIAENQRYCFTCEWCKNCIATENQGHSSLYEHEKIDGHKTHKRNTASYCCNSNFVTLFNRTHTQNQKCTSGAVSNIHENTPVLEYNMNCAMSESFNTTDLPELSTNNTEFQDSEFENKETNTVFEHCEDKTVLNYERNVTKTQHHRGAITPYQPTTKAVPGHFGIDSLSKLKHQATYIDILPKHYRMISSISQRHRNSTLSANGRNDSESEYYKVIPLYKHCRIGNIFSQYWNNFILDCYNIGVINEYCKAGLVAKHHATCLLHVYRGSGIVPKDKTAGNIVEHFMTRTVMGQHKIRTLPDEQKVRALLRYQRSDLSNQERTSNISWPRTGSLRTISMLKDFKTKCFCNDFNTGGNGPQCIRLFLTVFGKGIVRVATKYSKNNTTFEYCNTGSDFCRIGATPKNHKNSTELQSKCITKFQYPRADNIMHYHESDTVLQYQETDTINQCHKNYIIQHYIITIIPELSRTNTIFQNSRSAILRKQHRREPVSQHHKVSILLKDTPAISEHQRNHILPEYITNCKNCKTSADSEQKSENRKQGFTSRDIIDMPKYFISSPQCHDRGQGYFNSNLEIRLYEHAMKYDTALTKCNPVEYFQVTRESDHLPCKSSCYYLGSHNFQEKEKVSTVYSDIQNSVDAPKLSGEYELKTIIYDSEKTYLHSRSTRARDHDITNISGVHSDSEEKYKSLGYERKTKGNESLTDHDRNKGKGDMLVLNCNSVLINDSVSRCFNAISGSDKRKVDGFRIQSCGICSKVFAGRKERDDRVIKNRSEKNSSIELCGNEKYEDGNILICSNENDDEIVFAGCFEAILFEGNEHDRGKCNNIDANSQSDVVPHDSSKKGDKTHKNNIENERDNALSDEDKVNRILSGDGASKLDSACTNRKRHNENNDIVHSNISDINLDYVSVQLNDNSNDSVFSSVNSDEKNKVFDGSSEELATTENDTEANKYLKGDLRADTTDNTVGHVASSEEYLAQDILKNSGGRSFGGVGKRHIYNRVDIKGINNISDNTSECNIDFCDFSSDIISCDTSCDDETSLLNSNDGMEMNNATPNQESNCYTMPASMNGFENKCLFVEINQRHEDIILKGREKKRKVRKPQTQEAFWEPIELGKPEENIIIWGTIQPIYGNLNTLLKKCDTYSYLVGVFRNTYKSECERWREVVKRAHMEISNNFCQTRKQQETRVRSRKRKPIFTIPHINTVIKRAPIEISTDVCKTSKQREAKVRGRKYRSPSMMPQIDTTNCQGRKGSKSTRLGWIKNHVHWLIRCNRILNLRHNTLIYCLLNKEQQKTKAASKQ